MANVLCIKWGTKYDASYVNRLYTGVKKYMRGDGGRQDFRFVCLTDDVTGIVDGVDVYPLPETGFDETAFDAKKGGETWRKVGLFKENVADLDGDTLFLDLDVVITGDISPLFAYAPGAFVVIQDWLEKRRAKYMPWRHGKVGNTSVFRFHPTRHSSVFETFKHNQQWALDTFRIEQQFVSWALRHDMAFWPADWICSFKRHCRPLFPLNHWLVPYKPQGMKILVFHGYPLPPQAISGFKNGLFKSTKPATWLGKYWDYDV